MKQALIIIIIFSTVAFVSAQTRVTTFGLQVKPLIPSTLLGTGLTESSGDANQYSVDQKLGMSFGGVLRKGFTDWFSLETGINYTRRNYEAVVLNPATGYSDSSRFGIIGYEIPVTGLVFVKLSEQIFMDGAFGLAMDMFPSDVRSYGNNSSFQQTSYRSSWAKSKEVLPWVNTGLIANVGFEYRTEKSGYFYFGGSYHRPFRAAYNTFLDYNHSGVAEEGFMKLQGSYLTLDFKYFFHEDPEPRKPKVREDEVKSSWNRDK